MKSGDLVSIEDIPEWGRCVFGSVKKFNPVQSKVHRAPEDAQNSRQSRTSTSVVEDHLSLFAPWKSAY